jgi:hypothetical protein
MITPATAGNAYAQSVTSADRSLSGLVVDYDDPRLPIPEHAKRKTDKAVDYTVHSVEVNK